MVNQAIRTKYPDVPIYGHERIGPNSTVQQGADDGLTDYAIRPLSMPKLEPWMHWAGFETEFGKHINGVFLVAEAAAF